MSPPAIGPPSAVADIKLVCAAAFRLPMEIDR
jgi:hypothetical protein